MFDNLRFKVSKSITPFKKPEIFILDELETALPNTVLNQINVEVFSLPKITDNYSLNTSQIIQMLSFLNSPKVIIPFPKTEFQTATDILSLFEPLEATKVVGKSYRDEETKDKKERQQQTLFSDLQCKHGLKEGTCSICKEQVQERHRRESQPKEQEIDIFDLVFPILLPPLKLNNLTALLPGKELKNYQIKGVEFLYKNRAALLGDEMGLGKTIQTIMALKLLFHNGKAISSIIVCPKAVLGTWLKHLEEWAPEIRVLKVRGESSLRRLKWTYPSHVYVTTYETLRIDIEDIDTDKFDVCILDEAQKVKNPSAEVTKCVRKIEAKYRWGLSGTPLENRVEELISIFQYIKPGLLRNEDAPYTSLIKKKIKPFFLRRRKLDVEKELPQKVHNPVWINLTPAQQEAYDKAEQEGVVALNEQGDTVTVQHILALITKLKQICNYDVSSGESAKLDFLKEKLESVEAQGDKALIFSQFPEKTLKFIEPHLARYKPLSYHGGLSDRQRESIVSKFENEEDNKIMLLSVRAGGLGITLIRANYVYHFDQWWNPATSAQAEDRVHRIGQKKTVFVDTIQTIGTIEQRIHNLLETKRALFKEIVDDLSDTDLRVLSKEDLLGLFNLEGDKKDKDKTRQNNSMNLNKLSPEEFEHLVFKLYESMGYIVTLTSYSRDEGVDLYTKLITDSGVEKLAIQCKHYQGKVGVEPVRELFGVINHKQDISRGVIITSGEFTSGARDFASGKRIELYDRAYLLGLLNKYKISF
ncbi:MAG: Snf2 family helicase-like protein [Candidatus Daviesbacteria bacterium GW2011_GWA2_38_24]|uniref:Snf2 family helicase-like protein n=1 Tax=Candidatus Daviesbacteria bacterium GW2011_GWA2_38_24 TaxID=1618422 RepID=A0A0G0MPK3_9BACT|nr:MAG: Snf2 family helicase-like protein [Candidatus Daviesbacteria bacterium GW2011_GWA2_38_24]OGE23191.1 MAG: hypothetical protein A2688_03545 [Candidatus Daviesbacteria bacterium RIFCSPHIGHO2_01_FULL_38_8]